MRSKKALSLLSCPIQKEKKKKKKKNLFLVFIFIFIALNNVCFNN